MQLQVLLRTILSLPSGLAAQTVFSAINLGSHVGVSTGEKCIPTDLGVECTDYSMTKADKVDHFCGEYLFGFGPNRHSWTLLLHEVHYQVHYGKVSRIVLD
jgi:hypothetical protein